MGLANLKFCFELNNPVCITRFKNVLLSIQKSLCEDDEDKIGDGEKDDRWGERVKRDICVKKFKIFSIFYLG